MRLSTLSIPILGLWPHSEQTGQETISTEDATSLYILLRARTPFTRTPTIRTDTISIRFRNLYVLASRNYLTTIRVSREFTPARARALSLTIPSLSAGASSQTIPIDQFLAAQVTLTGSIGHHVSLARAGAAAHGVSNGASLAFRYAGVSAIGSCQGFMSVGAITLILSVAGLAIGTFGEALIAACVVGSSAHAGFSMLT